MTGTNGFEKTFHGAFGALHVCFDGTIRPILNPTGELKVIGRLFDEPSEADTLDAPIK